MPRLSDHKSRRGKPWYPKFKRWHSLWSTQNDVVHSSFSQALSCCDADSYSEEVKQS